MSAVRAMFLPHRLLERASRHPERVLLHHRGRDWTFAEVGAAAAGVAATLQSQGVRPGDRVAIAFPNSCEYAAAYFGAQLAGACAVTLDAAQPGQELAYAVAHSGSVAALFDAAPWKRLMETEAALPSLRSAILAPGAVPPQTVAAVSVADAIRFRAPLETHTPSGGDPAQIIYTSGTTGKPKGVVLSHRNLAANTDAIAASLSLREGDSVFAILAFSYSYGNSLLLTHVSCGGRVVIAPDFVFWKDVLDLMQRQQASGFAGIPSSFGMLLNRSDFLRREWPHLRYLTCAGGALPLPTLDQLRQQLPSVSVYIMYGQTEASARLACLPPERLHEKLGSAGQAIPGVVLTIRDDEGREVPRNTVGEIVARGDNVMIGYHNDPAATADVLRPDGLHTRDMGRMDDDGFLFITGRRDDVIKSGGYRIGPQEIEDAMLAVDGVAEAGATGVPDDLLGAAPVAFFVARSPDPQLLARIKTHLAAVLPRYKVPREIHEVQALPRTSNGKLQRRRLKEMLPAPPPAGAKNNGT